MTDKQIIIDGVDVHWCEHYTGNIGYLTDKNWTCRAKIQGTKCEDWSNCYFKRWQRKEQECEGLRYEVGSLENDRDILKEQLNQLKAENEQLKNNDVFSIRYFKDKCDVLKQTLTEIKEIMKKHCRKCKKHKFYHFQLCCTCKYTDILQKISECEGNDGL